MIMKIFCALLAFVLFPLTGCFAEQKINNQYPHIRFLGATQAIGGSAIFIDTGKTKFLVDYGLYYDEADQQKNRNRLPHPYCN